MESRIRLTTLKVLFYFVFIDYNNLQEAEKDNTEI